MIQTYFITLIVFVIIDIIWLALIAKKIYKSELGFIMSPKPNIIAAVVFYALFIFGLVYFVVQPAVDTVSFQTALTSGLLFGLITYGTYDLTNLATLKNWPLKITVIDLCWGTFLGGSVSVISYLIMTR
jgi:uncharacterized membrane protein